MAAAVRTYNFTVVSAEQREVAALAPVMIDKLVVVDAGHGGPDPGVVRGDVREKDITLAVALRLAGFLEQGGARVMLTRDKDSDVAKPDTGEGETWKRRDLKARVAVANENGADVFVSVHVNSFQEDNEHGAQTFSQPGCPDGRQLAGAIQSELQTLLRNTNRVQKECDYFTGRTTKMPSVVVEIGFLTNPREFSLLQQPNYQSKVAFAIYAGLVRYFAEKAGAVLSLP
ncbi:MAG: N-acetylmuramoyl-L-alanine amidase [Bacillota bacterium]